MAAKAAVVWLLGWRRQHCFDERHVEGEKKGSVEQQKAATAALRVAGKLQAAHGKVGVSLNTNCRFVIADCEGNCFAISLHDELVCGADVARWTFVGDLQDQ